jgi:hypothetical protein
MAKKNLSNYLSRFTLVIALIATSGCVTRKVYMLGVNPRKVKVLGGYKASDGSVALETDLIQRHGKPKRYFWKDSNEIRIEASPDGDKCVDLDCLLNKPHLSGAWEMIPNNFKNRDATHDELPGKFSASTFHPIDESVPNVIEGVFADPLIPNVQGGHLGHERAIWSYPCQILLIPAVAIDIVSVPFWLLINPHGVFY